MQTVVPSTWVPGRPSSYSSGNSAGWGQALAAGLAQYVGLGSQHIDAQARYEIVLHFMIFPKDPAYGNQPIARDHGLDLDNLTKETIDFLSDKKVGQSLHILWSDYAIHRIVASKELVGSTAHAGAWVTIRII
jgi:hypothetical protein